MSNLKAQFGMMCTLFFCKRKGYSTQKKTSTKIKFKGQFGMMEHLLMAVVLLMVIVAALFFFFGFQSTRSKGVDLRESMGKALLTTNLLSKADMLTREDGVFDDSKLAVFLDKDGCEEIKRIAGRACLKIETVRPEIGDEEILECEYNNLNYDVSEEEQCYKWTICGDVCTELKGKKSRGFSIPVNIFRKIENKVELGVLTVMVPA